MILSFSVENYLSFKEKITADFQAGTIKEHKENYFSPSNKSPYILLKSLGIFGHNASGKSNLMKAAMFMRDFVLNSSKESNSTQEIKVYPFLLSIEASSKPCVFEMVFILDSVKYRYGFSVSKTTVVSEWLLYTEKRKEEKIFVRAGKEYSFERRFREGLKGKFELFAELTRANTLFLSVLAQFNNTLSQHISTWFNDLILAPDSAHYGLIDFTASLMKVGDYRSMITEMIRKADIGIDSIEETANENAAGKQTFQDFVSSINITAAHSYRVSTGHFIYNDKNTAVAKTHFDLLQNESLGTQKLFGILGPILYALTQKKVIWIDEIDARLHTLLLESIISLFNSTKYNPNGAQLLFTTHNTTILKKNMRRDQMVFMEKDGLGESKMASLYLKDPKVRNDASFDKDYLLGRYGGIPHLGSQLNLFDKGPDSLG